MTVELKINNQIDFIPKMLSNMEEICKDHIERLQSANELKTDAPNATPLLSKGIWYAVEYAQMLQKFNHIERLNWIIKNGIPFHGLMPKTFVHIEDSELPTNRKLEAFRIAKNVLPSEALTSIQNSICLVGCTIARDIAVYKTLQDFLGDEKFNLLFASDSETPLELGTIASPHNKLFREVNLTSTDSLEPGDFCHFSNIQLYIPKHPFGNGRGYNVICKAATQEGAQFLGLGLKTEDCSIKAVEEALLNDFNAPQYSETFFTPSIRAYVYGKTLLRDEQKSKALVDSFKNCIFTQEQFDGIENRKAHAHVNSERRMLLNITRPNVDKIERLVKCSLENVRKVFKS